MLFVVLLLTYVVLFVMYSCALSTLRKVNKMNNVYCVYDSCSGIFGDPFIAINDAVAKRMFDYSLSNVSIPQYIRNDSVLYGIGFYDNKTGYFTSDVPPYVVSRGSTVVVSDPFLDSDTADLPEVPNHEK